MQRTRLSTLVSRISRQFDQWLVNPWRRLSVVTISLLFGYFLGGAVAAIAGQAAQQDVLISAVLVALSELISRIVYSRSSHRPDPSQIWSLFYDALNSLKVGALYAFCLEAFKLGS